MKNFSYHKKYHYALKYFVMAFPLILLLFSCLIKINNAYETDTTYYLGKLNYALSNFFINLKDLPMNYWYVSLIENLGFYVQTYEDLIVQNVLVIYPLYILWVYIFDLILDLFTLIPKMAHYFLNKLGGEKYYDK